MKSCVVSGEHRTRDFGNIFLLWTLRPASFRELLGFSHRVRHLCFRVRHIGYALRKILNVPYTDLQLVCDLRDRFGDFVNSLVNTDG